MKQALKYGCLGVTTILVGLAVLLFFLAWRAEPVPTTEQALITLNAREREALEKLCRQAGIQTNALRNIGGYSDYLFDHELNRLSFVVQDGHILGLCLRSVKFSSLPDFSELPFLEALDLQGAGLSDWPELAPLNRLTHLNLSGQPLASPGAGKLPTSLTKARFAGTLISDVAHLATLENLRELDLSNTPLSSFAPLLPLNLETLNLSNSQITSLPASLPKEGTWKVNLDGTPVLNPPGYSREWPFGSWISTTSRNEDTATGTISKDQVAVEGQVLEVTKSRGIELPRCTDPNAPPVWIEASCTSGKGRIWLEEPPDFFSSPWMTEGKVQGFGMLRGRGFVSAEIAPDKPAKLFGKMKLRTESRIYDMPAERRSESRKPPDWCFYGFYIEPLEGTTLSRISYKVAGPP